MKIKRMFLMMAIAVSSLFMSSCNNKFVDYVHNGSVTLQLDYQGKDFWDDGIEKVSLKSCIDGDTVHFTTSRNNPNSDPSSNVLKARFYGIDTPESTGKVQPFGKQASNFTKQKIKNAAEHGTIVVASPRQDYGEPSPDSTGSRYVSLVWISEDKENCPFNELILLNLYIVQEGFSWVKGVSEFPQYAGTFDAACQQAENLKKGLFSDEPDPYFNYGGYETASLLDIKREVIKSYQDPDHENAYNNANVRVQGTVVGYAANVLYIADYFTQDADPDVPLEGEYAGLNIFTGMSGLPSRFKVVGNYIEVCGCCVDSDEFGFQMSGCTFPSVSYGDTDARVIYYANPVGSQEQTPDEHQIDTTKLDIDGFNTMITNKDFSLMNCPVECTTELVVTKAYRSEKGYFTLNLKATSGTTTQLGAYITFIYNPDPSDPTVALTEESEYKSSTRALKLKIKGVYVPHITTSGNLKFQINPTSSADIVNCGYQTLS